MREINIGNLLSDRYLVTNIGETLIARLSSGVRYLMLTKLEFPVVWAAESAHEGLVSEDLIAQLGDTRVSRHHFWAFQ